MLPTIENVARSKSERIELKEARLPSPSAHRLATLNTALRSLRRAEPPYGRIGVVLNSYLANAELRRELAHRIEALPYPEQLAAVRALVTRPGGSLAPILTTTVRAFLFREGRQFLHHLHSLPRHIQSSLDFHYRDELPPPERHQQRARLYLEGLKLPPRPLIGPLSETIHDSWPKGALYASMTPQHLGDKFPSFASSVQMIHALEKLSPGCAATLHERFGIRVFARYPLSYLRALSALPWPAQNNPPALVWCNPASDHNGGCFAPHIVSTLNSRAKTNGLSLICLEASSARELHARISDVASRGYRLSGLILSGHSCGLEITLGEQRGVGSQLTVNAVAEIVSDVVPQLTQPVFPLLLDGCKTGELGNMAHDLSHGIGCPVGGVLGRAALLSAVIRSTEIGPVLQTKFSEGGTIYRRGVIIQRGPKLPLPLTA